MHNVVKVLMQEDDFVPEPKLMPFVVDVKGAIVQKGICCLHAIVQLEWRVFLLL